MSSTSKSPNPTLRINMAMSMDGHITKPTGTWSGLGTAEDLRRMDKLRKWADCVIVSRTSIIQDNPILYIRSNPNSKYHPKPICIIHNVTDKLSHQLSLFHKPHPPGILIVISNKTDQTQLSNFLKDYINFTESYSPKKSNIEKWEIIIVNDVSECKEKLIEKGMYKLLLEGGGTLNGYFLEKDLVDEVFTTVVPYVIAGKTTDRTFVSESFFTLCKFKLLSVHRRKNEVFLRYKKSRTSSQKN